MKKEEINAIRQGRPSVQVSAMLKRYYKRGKSGHLFGAPITEFTKEELIGAIEFMREDSVVLTEEHSRTLDMLMGTRDVNRTEAETKHRICPNCGKEDATKELLRNGTRFYYCERCYGSVSRMMP